MAEFDALQLPIFDIVVDSFLAHSQIIGCLLNPDQPWEFRPLVFFALPDCDFQLVEFALLQGAAGDQRSCKLDQGVKGFRLYHVGLLSLIEGLKLK